ncbi:MFS transporter [Pseudonocardia sichuanensis]
MGGFRSITRYQWLVLAGTTMGWGLEGFDASLYSLIVGPAVRELLGPDASSASVATHAGFAISLFLAGWAIGAIIFGTLADYFGRVRMLSICILIYAVGTAASAFAQEYWQLAALRFIAGLGSGVEVPVGAALIAETWSGKYRGKATGVMMSGFAGGFFLASVVYGLLGSYGWRVTIATAILPAFVAVFVRRYLHEPKAMVEVIERRSARKAALADGAPRTVEDRFVLVQVLTRPLVRHTALCILIFTGALFAFWSTTTWTPDIIRDVVARDGITGADAVGYVATATAMLNLGGVLGYASWGFIADAIGRRGAFLISFGTAAIGLVVLYPFDRPYAAYLWLLPVVGFGVFGALAGPSVYFPELFPPAVRATAIAVTNSAGRFLTVPGPLIAGTIAAVHFDGNTGLAVVVVSSVIVLGVVGVALSPESRGRFLFEQKQPVPPSPAPVPAPITTHLQEEK